MTNWLDEIEGRIKNKYAQALDCGEGDLALDVAIADGEDMARVLRELTKLYFGTVQEHNLSHFAKELLK